MEQQKENGGDLGACGYVLFALSIILVVLFFPFSLCFTIKIVQEYERAVIFRLGRVVSGGAKGPGMFFVYPCLDEFKKVDLPHDQYFHPLQILTKDSVTVAVDAVVYSRIFDPTMSVCNVENAQYSTKLLAATTLRNVLGTKNMSELLSERETISEQMQTILDVSTDPWGIKVERVEIKDVRLPQQLQRAMAAEAEASREARAKDYKMKQEFQRNINSEDNDLGFCGNCCVALSTILIIFTFPFSLCFIIKIVQEYERVVIFRLGRVISGGARGPGLFIVFPCIDEYVKIDLRMVSVNIPPQEVSSQT
ncbi:STOM [Mytilus coruscus]|uniref:STOM n=1 Tax=Mytilus coruscus TaxID=42192 RepID=A0A6J8C4N9_MYTCO|nr:STOM [Mytilus coruscus]